MRAVMVGELNLADVFRGDARIGAYFLVDG
jgi:hypothetical protein